jgi:hypothetical protein
MRTSQGAAASRPRGRASTLRASPAAKAIAAGTSASSQSGAARAARPPDLPPDRLRVFSQGRATASRSAVKLAGMDRCLEHGTGVSLIRIKAP